VHLEGAGGKGRGDDVGGQPRHVAHA
jgi:hypothetical protein